MFADFKLTNLRVLALTIHLISTGMLIWTKFDPIHVAMIDINDNEEFDSINTSYMSLLAFAVIFIVFQLAFFLGRSPSVITLGSVMHLCLDFLASFFNFWIALDGLSWFTYLNVWLLCVLVPTVYDAVMLCVLLSNNLFVTRSHRGIMERIYTWWYGKPESVTD